MWLISLLVCASAALVVSTVTPVTIHNDVPRLDQYGHIVNAHDGSVINYNLFPELSQYHGIYFM